MIQTKQVHFASYGTFKQGEKIGPACWPFFDLLVIHKGKLRIHCSGKELQLEEFDAILIYPNTQFNGRVLSSKIVASVHHFDLASGPWLNKTNGFERLNGNARALKQVNASLELQREFHGYSTVARTATSFILELLLANNGEKETPKPFDKLLQNVSENLQFDWNLESLALKAGYSTSHFRRIFREYYGESPGKYIREMRLELAARLLREGIKTQKEIAELAGYLEPSHFHVAFRKQFNLTPGQYRKRFRFKA